MLQIDNLLSRKPMETHKSKTITYSVAELTVAKIHLGSMESNDYLYDAHFTVLRQAMDFVRNRLP